MYDDLFTKIFLHSSLKELPEKMHLPKRCASRLLKRRDAALAREAQEADWPWCTRACSGAGIFDSQQSARCLWCSRLRCPFERGTHSCISWTRKGKHLPHRTSHGSVDLSGPWTHSGNWRRQFSMQWRLRYDRCRRRVRPCRSVVEWRAARAMRISIFLDASSFIFHLFNSRSCDSRNLFGL